MTTMLEKIAEAMAAEIERQITPQVAEHKAGKWGSAQSHFSGSSAIFGTCQINGEVDLREVARAALLAIREPDEAMEQAADSLEPRPDWWPDEPGERNTPAQHFTAMIDAILNEKPETTT